MKKNMRLCFGLFLLLLFGCKHIPVSVDEDVMAALANKDVTQEKLITAVKARLN